jgi:ATP-binding cassette subfamily B protein
LETVIEAAKLVGVHEMITQLPDGYNFEVGERGVTLSMGQRQLIAFVRALVYNPKVLILDEATSSIDTESELLIQKATETLVKGRTSIIIAHRLSTIQHADKIMVLDKGGVVEIGTPAELMKLEDGWYRKLYETQFKLQELG